MTTISERLLTLPTVENLELLDERLSSVASDLEVLEVIARHATEEGNYKTSDHDLFAHVVSFAAGALFSLDSMRDDAQKVLDRALACYDDTMDTKASRKRLEEWRTAGSRSIFCEKDA
jgi:hypothetical protein